MDRINCLNITYKTVASYGGVNRSKFRNIKKKIMDF